MPRNKNLTRAQRAARALVVENPDLSYAAALQQIRTNRASRSHGHDPNRVIRYALIRRCPIEIFFDEHGNVVRLYTNEENIHQAEFESASCQAWDDHYDFTSDGFHPETDPVLIEAAHKTLAAQLWDGLELDAFDTHNSVAQPSDRMIRYAIIRAPIEIFFDENGDLARVYADAENIYLSDFDTATCTPWTENGFAREYVEEPDADAREAAQVRLANQRFESLELALI